MTTIEIVIIILLLLILFYPKVIVDFARGLGEITREFKKNEKGSRKYEEPVLRLARELGIDVRGKTYSEILEEIRRKIKNHLDRQHIEYVG
ncbi:MAG: twin-arginine translocase TatA/TatE family subunit [Nitrososphaerota archaeon]